MTCQSINKKAVSSLLIVFSFFYSFSQEAEKTYHREFSKLSFVFQPSYQTGFLSQNNDGSAYPSIKFNDSFSHQFGFYYNFAQRGNFNFKTGLIAKEFYPLFDLNVSKEDLGLPPGESFLTDFNPINSFIFSIPIKTEYFIPFNSDVNIVLGLGLNLNLSTGGNENVITSITINTGSQATDVFLSKTEQDQITFSTDFSVGLNYNFRFALLQVDFFYSFNLPYAAMGEYKIYNLENTPDKFGIFNINGDFYGLSFQVTPKKGWLKRSKKSIK